MSYTINTVFDKERGCGWRKPGGLYLMSNGSGASCCALPIELSVCWCCGQGIKPTRGFTWISSQLLISKTPPKLVRIVRDECSRCPVADPAVLGERVGLLWIGEKFYKSTRDFDREADASGISRRISQVPRDFEIGLTWVALAHRKAITFYNEQGEPEFLPGVFRLFRPDRIEYVVTGSETDVELERLEKRGFTLVRIVREGEQQSIL